MCHRVWIQLDTVKNNSRVVLGGPLYASYVLAADSFLAFYVQQLGMLLHPRFRLGNLWVNILELSIPASLPMGNETWRVCLLQHLLSHSHWLSQDCYLWSFCLVC